MRWVAKAQIQQLPAKKLLPLTKVRGGSVSFGVRWKLLVGATVNCTTLP
jgi:hypothetical protein